MYKYVYVHIKPQTQCRFTHPVDDWYLEDLNFNFDSYILSRCLHRHIFIYIHIYIYIFTYIHMQSLKASNAMQVHSPGGRLVSRRRSRGDAAPHSRRVLSLKTHMSVLWRPSDCVFQFSLVPKNTSLYYLSPIISVNTVRFMYLDD